MQQAFEPLSPPQPPSVLDLIQVLFAPTLHPVDWPNYVDFEGLEHELGKAPVWTESLGSRLCIVDIDTRPLNESNQIMNKNRLNWDKAEYTAAGMLNHYLYGTEPSIQHKYQPSNNHSQPKFMAIPTTPSTPHHCRTEAHSGPKFPLSHILSPPPQKAAKSPSP